MSINQLAYTVDEAAQAARVGRTLLYAEMQAGRLRYSKVGKRRLIPVEALRDWLESHSCAANGEAA